MTLKIGKYYLEVRLTIKNSAIAATPCVRCYYGTLDVAPGLKETTLSLAEVPILAILNVRKLAGFGMPPNASKWKHSGSLETSPTDANICAIGTLLGSNKWTMWTGSPVPSHVEAWKDPCPPWPHKY